MDISTFSSSLVEVRNVSESTISTYEIWMRLIDLLQLYMNIMAISFGLSELSKRRSRRNGLEGISSHNGLADLLVMEDPFT